MIRKYLFIVLALLLTFGVANVYATNIPQMVDPKNYPTVWTEVVYNGSGSTIYSGYIVQWDFDTSDSDAGTIYDDTAPWVKTADSVDDIWTAGVVVMGSNILNGDVGRIIIHGPAVVKMSAAARCTVNTVVSTDAAGMAYDEAGGADLTTLGICIKASAAGNDIGAEVYADSALIYVNPVQEGN